MPVSVAHCSGLRDCRLPSTAVAVPRSDLLCRNPLEAAAAENRPYSLLVFWEAACVCAVPLRVRDRVVPVGNSLLPAVPALAVAVGAGPDPGHGYADRIRRVEEYIGYTSFHLLCQKTCHAGHLCGSHSPFQLLNPLAA